MVTAPGVPVGDVGSKGLVFLLELKAHTHTHPHGCVRILLSPQSVLFAAGDPV